MEKQIIDLGWANAWDRTPEELQRANKLHCETREYPIGRNLTKVEVETPGSILVYRIDSSD